MLAFSATVVLLAVACGPSAPAQQAGAPTASAATASAAASAAQTPNLRGQELTLWQVPYVPLGDVLKDFEAQTGVKVKVEDLAQAGYEDKLKLAQLGKDSSFDVFEVQSAGFIPGYISREGVEPLDAYINDKNKTPASWNYEDLSPNLVGSCAFDGKIYCVPWFASHTFLYYNKKIFAEAGISAPPKTMQELIQFAQKTNTPAHAGICMRATTNTSNSYPGYMMYGYYQPYSSDNKALFMDSQWQPQFTTPAALKFANDYATLMRQYAPAGVASYGFSECNRDFSQGKIAMYLEANVWASDFLDPTKSTVSKDVGFTVIPCPPTNPQRCIMNAMAGWQMNKNSKHKDAAWELLKFLSSKETMIKLMKASKNYSLATRASVVPEVLGAQAGRPEDLSAATSYALAHVYPRPYPPIPELDSINNAFRIALSKIVSGQSSAEAAMTEAQASMVATLKQGGYIK